MTVRQTPLTAMESPCRASDATRGPRTARTTESPPTSVTAATSPSSSTMPVNMSALLLPDQRGEPQVGADPRDVGELEADGLGDGRHAGVHQGGAAGAEKLRRDVPDDLVDETRGQEAAGQRRAALEQRAAHPAGV